MPQTATPLARALAHPRAPVPDSAMRRAVTATAPNPREADAGTQTAVRDQPGEDGEVVALGLLWDWADEADDPGVPGLAVEVADADLAGRVAGAAAGGEGRAGIHSVHGLWQQGAADAVEDQVERARSGSSRVVTTRRAAELACFRLPGAAADLGGYGYGCVGGAGQLDGELADAAGGAGDQNVAAEDGTALAQGTPRGQAGHRQRGGLLGDPVRAATARAGAGTCSAQPSQSR